MSDGLIRMSRKKFDFQFFLKWCSIFFRFLCKPVLKLRMKNEDNTIRSSTAPLPKVHIIDPVVQLYLMTIYVSVVLDDLMFFFINKFISHIC
jgi:hypothetical protein